MSITDELREYLLCNPPANYADFSAIAGRIDAEHERALSEQFESLTVDMEPMTDEDMAEHGWMRLPKDADGVPIHVGDTVTCARSVWEVTGLRLTSLGWGVCCTIFNDHDGSGTNVYPPRDLRHYHAPTIEDVLRDFAYCCEEGATEQDIDEIITEYAAKLRLAEGDK